MELRKYQEKLINFSIKNPFSTWWVGMGMGKTAAALFAIDKLINEQFEIARVLIIAPLRVAKYVWPEEIKKWKPNLSYIVLHGKNKWQSIKKKKEVYIINREGVPQLIKLFQDRKWKWKFDMLVIDESSSFKNPTSLRFRKLKTILNDVHRMIQLTGTPASNGYHDLWSQIFLLDRGERLESTITKYRSKYLECGYEGWSWTLRHNCLKKVIKNKLQDICISLDSKDYLDLPEMIFKDVQVEFDKKSRAWYEEIKSSFVLLFEHDEVTAVTAAVLSGKLRQISNGAPYLEDIPVRGKKRYLVFHDTKLDALDELLEESKDEPILLAYCFVSDYERIKKRFPFAVNIKDSDSIKNWNAGKIKLFCAHPRSAAHGLNLQDGGHNIVWFGLEWDLELYLQFNKRLHRIGQSKPVLVQHIVVKDSIEERVAKTLQNKESVQQCLLDSVKQ